MAPKVVVTVGDESDATIGKAAMPVPDVPDRSPGSVTVTVLVTGQSKLTSAA